MQLSLVNSLNNLEEQKNELDSNLFQQAQLAEAAYADYSKPNTSTEQALTAEGMSTAQAADFVLHWRVIDRIPNTANGFFAAVFEKLWKSGVRSSFVA